MKTKKRLAFLAALCMTLGTIAFAACGGGDNGGNSSVSVSSSEESISSENVSSSEEISSSAEISNSAEITSSEEISSEEEIPFGALENPHPCYYSTDEETGETSAVMHVPTIKAHSAEYYIISRSASRVICVKQANVTIIYGENTYSAKEGDIEFQSQGDPGNMFYAATIQIVNDTDADINLVMTFKEVVEEETA